MDLTAQQSVLMTHPFKKNIPGYQLYYSEVCWRGYPLKRSLMIFVYNSLASSRHGNCIAEWFEVCRSTEDCKIHPHPNDGSNFATPQVSEANFHLSSCLGTAVCDQKAGGFTAFSPRHGEIFSRWTLPVKCRAAQLRSCWAFGAAFSWPSWWLQQWMYVTSADPRWDRSPR